VAATFGLEPSTVMKWWQRYRATGADGAAVARLVYERDVVLERVAVEAHVSTQALAGGPQPRSAMHSRAPPVALPCSSTMTSSAWTSPSRSPATWRVPH